MICSTWVKRSSQRRPNGQVSGDNDGVAECEGDGGSYIKVGYFKTTFKAISNVLQWGTKVQLRIWQN